MNHNIFENIISLESLFLAWNKFKVGKGKRKDVQLFARFLEENICQLHRDLISGTYKHGDYYSFTVYDPKRRHIHTANIRDRIVHQSIYSELTKIFEPKFIFHSYSCRIGKGTHKGVLALAKMTRKISRNYTKPCFALKCDIKKCFDNVDHRILLSIISKRIKDNRAIRLINCVISSYCINYPELDNVKGIPLGNITSQIFINIYMNELDQYIKHKQQIKYYLRFSDDFVFLADNKEYLVNLIPVVQAFLNNSLKLNLHPQKIIFRKLHQGIDFLGYIIFPKFFLIRNKTKKRMFKKLNSKLFAYLNGNLELDALDQSLQSYLGILSHANAYKLSRRLIEEVKL